ncbi:EAL domain-containing protein [Halomonas organivorans]|uniref:Putative signal transduction protein with EAL and GGDEF domain n=1 Tax=Halomonas organivorans TaxID=257772 RepID=A0A7W5BVU4_9GAMM|nr:EAL domain-containing protein [Halomonas organivorans]MBB3140082.1 putative signal transduction protein with EAL and GGDEF domain [Halomonas organivorans]
MRRWAGGALLLAALSVVGPCWGAVSTLVIAPGEPGQRLDRQLLAELGDRLEADQGPGALQVVYLRGGAVSTESLYETLLRRDLLEGSRVILLHDAAVAAYRKLVATRHEAAADQLVAYGVFSPIYRQWLRQQGAGHLDLLPVLLRHLAWVRHASGAPRLVGWVTVNSPLRALESILTNGEGRVDALGILGQDLPGARDNAAHVLLALPDLAQRQQALSLLQEAGSVWCLMPEWLKDGCVGGVQPDASGVAERLLTLLEDGGEATAPAVPRVRYADRQRVAESLRDDVQYVDVPESVASRRRWGDRLILAASGLAIVAMMAMLVAMWMERRRRRQRLRFDIDELTGLPSRPRLERRLQDYLENRQRLQLCWIGFDRLDGLRDSLGAAGTEEAIQRIAKRLRRVTRGEGYVAHIEGDVFAVMSVLPVADDGRSPVGMALAERLQESLSAPFRIGRADRMLLPRIGVALSVEGTTPFALLEEAQGAARQMLRSGERRPRMLEAESVASKERFLALTEVLERLSPERLAVQLRLSVEPHFLLADRRRCGGELIVRWRHPHWGDVPQEELVRLAETAGRRALLDRTVCRLAVEGLASLARAVRDHEGVRAIPTRWALPVGIGQVMDTAFVDELANRCRELALATSCFELQLQGEELGEPWSLQAALRYCRDQGFGVALKGLAHSSHALDAIFRQPLSRLVLEAELMTGIPRDRSALLLLKSLRDMAKLGGHHITVTGVATSDQLVAIRRMNFVSAQGRLFDVSQPLEAMTAAPLVGEAGTSSVWGAGATNQERGEGEQLGRGQGATEPAGGGSYGSGIDD